MSSDGRAATGSTEPPQITQPPQKQRREFDPSAMLKRKRSEPVLHTAQTKASRQPTSTAAATSGHVLSRSLSVDPKPIQTASFSSFGSRDNGDYEKDTLTGLRIKNRMIASATVTERMMNRKLVPITDIRLNMVGDDIPGDWVLAGVVTFKSDTKKAKNGDPFCMVRIGDLRGSSVNLFMFREVAQAHGSEEIGSIVAILNPKIVQPSERASAIGLNLDDARKWMKIGDAVDIGFCKGLTSSKQKCQTAIDLNRGMMCEEHQLAAYKMARIRRQEFATGNAPFYIGAPDQKMRPSTKVKRVVETVESGTYVFKGQTISVHESQAKSIEHRKETSAPVFDEEQKRKIKAIMSTKTAGGKFIRAINKVADPEPALDEALFGPTALARMGGNPITGDGFITRPHSGPNTPTRSGRGGMAGVGTPNRLSEQTSSKSPSTSPSALRALKRNASLPNTIAKSTSIPNTSNNDSDSDYELEIIGT